MYFYFLRIHFIKHLFCTLKIHFHHRPISSSFLSSFLPRHTVPDPPRLSSISAVFGATLHTDNECCIFYQIPPVTLLFPAPPFQSSSEMPDTDILWYADFLFAYPSSRSVPAASS